MFITGKYVKIRFKNRRPPYQKHQKYYKNWTKETAFVYILGFNFYGVSHAKTDLHNKYIFNFKFGWFFEQDHLWNVFILGVYGKRWPKCARISKQKLRVFPFHRKDFKWKEIWGYGVSFWKNGRFVCRT